MCRFIERFAALALIIGLLIAGTATANAGPYEDALPGFTTDSFSDTDGIRLRRDHVLEDMLRGLDAHVSALDAAFDPEPAAPSYEHHEHDHG